MAFDSVLAQRIRAALGQRSGIAERKMSDGPSFLQDGRMSL
jgi:hypothetical protein